MPNNSLIDALNAALEVDHDLVKRVLLTDLDINEFSPLYESARVDRGVKVASGLDIISYVTGGIIVVMEDGIIQRFE